jgi:hypothetical protein
VYSYDRRASVSVKIDMGKASEVVSDYLSDLASRPSRHPEDGPGYTEEEAAKDAKRIIGDIEKAMKEMAEMVSSAAHRLTWLGSTIQIRPYLNSEDPIWNGEGEQRDFKDAEVFVDKGSVSKNSPGFTLFVDGSTAHVDDVLDAGDTDFFRSPEAEADYFGLVNELRSPGGHSGEKVVTLYTARPAKDHKFYEDAKNIPTNVFLTTSYSEAEGYSMDMGEREIWKVRIRLKHLVETLNAGGRKNYQAVAPGSSVPVESITPA